MARQVERILLYDDFHTEGRRTFRLVLFVLLFVVLSAALFVWACWWARSQVRGPVLPANAGEVVPR